MTDYAAMNPDELRELERTIARQHINKFPTISVIWAFTNVGCWLALWPLVFMDIIPLWLGFIVSTVNSTLFYLPSHEAQHSIIARPGEKLRWLNELVGHMCAMPMAIPFRVLRETHMEHHKHANDPELDPDYDTHAKTALGAIYATMVWRQPRPNGKPRAYGRTLERLNRPDLLLEGAIYELVFYGTLIALAWNGLALEAALLWWLPRHIALSYLLFFLSWAPHNPGLSKGRYKDTRSFKSRLGNIGSMGMQFHIIHHLYPRIPLDRTPQAYWELKPIIERLGSDVHEL